MKRSDAA